MLNGLPVVQPDRLDTTSKAKIWDFTAATLRCDTPIIGIDAANKDYVDSQISGHDTFLELTDTPDSYSGQAGKVVLVNGTEDGLEFSTVLTTDEKVKIDASDTGTDYLDPKLLVGAGLTKVINNVGGYETITIDIYTALSILTFTNDVNVVEKGATVNDVNLNWTLNLPGSETSQSINQGVGAIPVGIYTKALTGLGLTSDLTWTLSVTDGVTPDTANTTVYFRNKRYWGAYNALITLDSEVLANLSGEFGTSKAVTKTFDASAGTPPNYLYYCYPTSWGLPTITYFGGFAFSDYTVSTITNFTNASGYICDYYLLRSNNTYNSSGLTWQLV